MRIIALANPDSDGVLTDAEATVGDITFDGTVGLLFLGTVAGIMGGAVYLGLRRWLPVPAAWKGLTYGIVSLLTVGHLLFDTHNADFQIFEPVLFISQGGPFGTTDVIVHRVFRDFYGDFNFGMAGAGSIVITAIIFCFSLLTLKWYSAKEQ